MRSWWQQSVSVLAIYVIALATILSAFSAPPAFSTTLDPFSVICHSAAPDAAQTDSGPAAPASLPNHACDHCTLCGAAPTAAVAFDAVLIGYVTPNRPLHALRPADSLAQDDIGASPRQAQGPPATT